MYDKSLDLCEVLGALGFVSGGEPMEGVTVFRPGLGGKCPTCGRINAIINECRCDPNNFPTTLPSNEGANYEHE